MTDNLSLTNHFLMAMPNLVDPNFAHSVTYICQHDQQGAMGIVLTQPLDLTIATILAQMDIELKDSNIGKQPVYLGGPVQNDRGFILHQPTGNWDSKLDVTSEVGLTTSRDILEAIALGAGPQRMLFALGYAGWGPGQLEAELTANVWLSGPASTEIMFSVPSHERWAAAAALVGVDLTQLSDQAGHA